MSSLENLRNSAILTRPSSGISTNIMVFFVGVIRNKMEECSNRKIAYALLQKFKDKYPEWFEEKKSPDGVSVTEEELKELKPMPFMAMVSSVGSNDEKDMYDYLGGVKNDKRSEELDAAFKQEKSNFKYCHCCRYVDYRL